MTHDTDVQGKLKELTSALDSCKSHLDQWKTAIPIVLKPLDRAEPGINAILADAHMTGAIGQDIGSLNGILKLADMAIQRVSCY